MGAKGPVVLSQLVRTLRGGSNPLLVRASDGLTYVVKFQENPQGAQVLFNEAAGSGLYRCLGLPIARWRPLRLTRAFIERYPALWSVADRPSPGLCFGSLHLGNQDNRVFEILPSVGLKRVRKRDLFWLAWLVDICAQHSDNRQVLFVQHRDRAYSPVFIDHGHMFGGPRGGTQPHFRASRYLDPRVYPVLDSDLGASLSSLVQSKLRILWHDIEAIPDEWKSVSSLQAFADCLQTICTPRLLNAKCNLLRGAYRKLYGTEADDSGCRCNCTDAVLCPGVQVA